MTERTCLRAPIPEIADAARYLNELLRVSRPRLLSLCHCRSAPKVTLRVVHSPGKWKLPTAAAVTLRAAKAGYLVPLDFLRNRVPTPELGNEG